MNEFEIIEQYFKQVHPQSQGDLVLGIGDDAAIVTVPEDSELLISMDTLVAGTHFPLETAPEDIAYKALAVNLSDMAAMGAFPRWVSLSLALPEDDTDWLKRFSSSFNQFSNEKSLVLIGGDITKAPLSVTIQIHGIAPRGKSLRRDGAGIGDSIYVTGKLGAAAYAYQNIISSNSFPSPTEEELQRFLRPEPRIE
ncbi:MAG: thiamine-phosphate kinase, partial [Proteobacteria bacterium]|nr:thiamine-phosphate kinase [Pseudomonadota bacterium]